MQNLLEIFPDIVFEQGAVFEVKVNDSAPINHDFMVKALRKLIG